MNTENAIFEKMRELKPMLQKEYLVTEIGLFGSYSDNTFTDNSDIDILIELERPIGWRIFTLEIFLEKTLGRKIDLVTRGALKVQLKDQILKQVKYI
jgi:predicted nucleotidyltransferase